MLTKSKKKYKKVVKILGKKSKKNKKSKTIKKKLNRSNKKNKKNKKSRKSRNSIRNIKKFSNIHLKKKKYRGGNNILNAFIPQPFTDIYRVGLDSVDNVNNMYNGHKLANSSQPMYDHYN
tara:strand:- start:111 stop:470 length:360 start_codon:yes stop_codon:yes gene_type:complete